MAVDALLKLPNDLFVSYYLLLKKNNNNNLSFLLRVKQSECMLTCVLLSKKRRAVNKL